MLEDKMSGMQNPIIHKMRQELNELQSLSRDQARTMPPEFYTSEDFLELEKEHTYFSHLTDFDGFYCARMIKKM